MELLDAHGSLIAPEWDEVEVGGRGDINDFRASADSVVLIRSFR